MRRLAVTWLVINEKRPPVQETAYEGTYNGKMYGILEYVTVPNN